MLETVNPQQSPAPTEGASTDENIIASMRAVAHSELDAAAAVVDNIDQTFVTAVGLIAGCTGKVVFTGVGKSGHIGAKLAATFASVGTPSFFMHATEAVHGDLGMVADSDLIVAISNSGETTEVLRVLPALKVKGLRIIAITGDPDSTLARNADLTLAVHVDREADRFNLAPTSSSTAVLIVGDALALTVESVIGLDEEGFGLNHPGGALGRRLVDAGILTETLA